MSDAEQREPGTVESPLLERLLRRTVGWPGLVATERPGRIRLQRRAEAGRRPLLDAVARRWAVGRGEAWPGGRRLPLAVVSVPRREDRSSTEPAARERVVDRPLTVAPAPVGAEAPRPSAASPSSPPTPSSTAPPVVEAPARAEAEPPAPRIEAADAPPPTSTFAMPLLRRLGGPPAAPRMPLRAEARGERLAPALARRTGPPTRRDAIAATPSTPDVVPVVGAETVEPSPVAPAPTRRVPGVPSSGTRVDPAAPPPRALPLQPPRVRTRPAVAPVVLGAAPRPRPSPGPRPSVDTTVPTPTTAEIFEWPVLLPFAAGGARGTRPAAPPVVPGRVEHTVASPRDGVAPLDRSGGVPFPLAAPPSQQAPWPARALPLARPAASGRRAVAARSDPTTAPAPPAAHLPDARPLSTDARPPRAEHDPLSRVEPRPKKTKTSRLADEVYELIIRRLESERLRRGL